MSCAARDAHVFSWDLRVRCHAIGWHMAAPILPQRAVALALFYLRRQRSFTECDNNFYFVLTSFLFSRLELVKIGGWIFSSELSELDTMSCPEVRQR